MDQNSGRGPQRSAPSRDARTRPRHQLDEQPPAEAAAPLPRRSAQGHMEPQLRQPGGTGTGTPFTPFAVERAAAKAAGKPAADNEAADEKIAEKSGDEAGDGPSPTAEGSLGAAETSRPADFRKGARRGHRPDPSAVKPVR